METKKLHIEVLENAIDILDGRTPKKSLDALIALCHKNKRLPLLRTTLLEVLQTLSEKI